MRLFGDCAVLSCVVPDGKTTLLSGRHLFNYSWLSIILRDDATGHKATGVGCMNRLVAFLIAFFFKLNLSIDGVDRSWIHT